MPYKISFDGISVEIKIYSRTKTMHFLEIIALHLMYVLYRRIQQVHVIVDVH